MRNVKVLGSVLIVCSAAVAVLAACSDDSSPKTGSPTGPGSTSTTTVRITAAQGGKVVDPTGKAMLEIPAGALSADTDITVSIASASNGSVADVATFGPSGLKFAKPATLQLKAAALSVPDGKAASVAVEENGKWVPIANSKVEADGKTVSGNIEHFSSFSIVIIDGKVVLKAPQSCGDATNFTACGGDPSGTWLFDHFCLLTDIPIGGDPFNGKCPAATGEIDISWKRDITFAGTTATVSAGEQLNTVTQHIPLSCATSITDGGITTCAQLQSELTDADKPTTCVDNAGTCDCSSTETEAKEATTSTVAIDGTKMTITDSDQKVTNLDFCVSGDVLLAKGKDAEQGFDFIWALKRK